MPNFIFDQLPVTEDVPQLAIWMSQQLQALERAMNEGLTDIRFVELHSEPARPRTGMTVLADGTNWDPGSGQGLYTYYNSQWNKLG